MSRGEPTAHSRRPAVLFVDDELSLLEEMPARLRREGYDVFAASTPAETLKIIRKQSHLDAVIMDLQLPMNGCREIGLRETAGGRYAGLVLAQEVRRKFKRTPIVFWSVAFDKETRTRIVALGNARLVPKAAGPAPVLEFVRDSLEGISAGTRPVTFIVHGHDEATMCELRDYLQTELGFPEPIVLKEHALLGQTLIEKIESYAYTVDVVFVLLTPDDRVVQRSARSGKLYRARQNVIFELGYFIGVLGRTSGKVILLFKHPVELPSDLWGVLGIDISDGVVAAGPAIARELSEWI